MTQKRNKIRDMDVAFDKVMMVLDNGAVYTVAPPPRLANAAIADWSDFHIAPDRESVDWPMLRVRIEVPQDKLILPEISKKAPSLPRTHALNPAVHALEILPCANGSFVIHPSLFEAGRQGMVNSKTERVAFADWRGLVNWLTTEFVAADSAGTANDQSR